MKLADHVKKLCRIHRIKAYRVRSVDECGSDERTIYIKTVVCEHSYAIALHEIGHVLVGRKPCLTEEAEAWERAEQLALRWTPKMSQTRSAGLLTYARDAHDKYRVIAKPRLLLPPPGHIFWTYLDGTEEGKALLGSGRPSWLHENLPTVPWGAVVLHEDRPRCENCKYWREVASIEDHVIPEKKAVGLCLHRDVPLGAETTPAGALCGSAWESVVHLPLVPGRS